MNKPWWEDPICWLCDFWWLLLLILLLIAMAVITRGYWSPALGFSSPPIATPVSTAISPTPDTSGHWQHFQGTGYTLDYPPDWFAYHPQVAIQDPSGIVYDLILSTAPGNQSPQGGTADEKARVTVWYIPQPSEPVPNWIAQRWAWLNTSLETVQLNGTDALSASPSPSDGLQQKFFWVQAQGNLYTIETYGITNGTDMEATIQKIISTLKFQ